MRPIRKALELLAERTAAGKRVHSTRHIAQVCNVSRPAVDAYAARAKAAGLQVPLPEGLTDAELEYRLFPAVQEGSKFPEPDWAEIDREMHLKGSTLGILHEEYKTNYPDGMGLSTFCKRYSKWKKQTPPSMRFEFKDGQAALVDYAGRTVEIVGPETFKAQIFVGVLGSSGLMYVEAMRSQAKEEWIAAHNHMFAAWGGTTRTIICDNLKSAVVKASNRGEPELQPEYAEMACHYGCSVKPARPKHPKDKARVEKTVQHVTNQVLFPFRHREFFSIDELNIAIRERVDVLNKRPLKRRKESRLDLFEAGERAALRPLPREPYEFSVRRLLAVGIDYHIEFEKHAYSVPFTLIGERVECRITRGSVSIYHKNKLVAAHPRSYVQGTRTTDRAHLAPNHEPYFEWNPEEALSAAEEFGPSSREFLAAIFAQSEAVPHQQRAWKTLQEFASVYGQSRLEKACERALELRAVTTLFVRNVLKYKMESFGSHEIDEPAVRVHENLRGPDEFILT